jgi:adenine-specific DNA-methyltransferase
MNSERTRNRKKLQSLLRDLFQFDHADLDFGIYRIMNEKRDEIERFIEHDLLDAVEEALAHFQETDREELEAQSAEKRAQLGDAAFDETGVVREQFRSLPIAKEYMELRRQLRQLGVAEETEARVFNDLWRFFSRYYDQGDFLTERRYSSRQAKYCLPYNGEEVLLHWANRDQYYVKTSERFTDYRFTAGPSLRLGSAQATSSGQAYTVWFRLQRAEVPQDNVKGDKRYFVLHDEEPLAYDDGRQTLTIPFAYRPLSEEEEAHYLGVYNAQQPKSSRRKTLDRSVLCVALESEILNKISAPDLKAHLAAVPEGSETSALGKHLNRYTARHTMDYFVHKDLGSFLRRELDVFLKREVLRLDDVMGDDAGEVTAHVLTRMRVVRQIAHRIIAFLAQIEDFQKRLFEKRKFVVQTDYCLTLDRVPKEFYPEILANEAQLDEWRRLYRMDEWDGDPFWQGEFDEAFLEHHPYMMVDTAFFDEDFKARLLATFDDLDRATDGLLIHGENFQALNLLMAKYGKRVKCIYIDPPYNTGSDDNFAYKDNYQHSTWLTMMQDRLGLTYTLLTSDGVVFTSIDDREKSRLRELMDIVYGRGMFVASFVRKRRAPSAMSQDMVSQDHEYVLAYGGSDFTTFVGVEKDYSAYSNPDNDPRGDWVAGDLTVGMTKDQRPNQYYNLVDPKSGKVYPPDPNRVWAYFPETMQQKIEEGLIIFPEDTSQRPKLKRFKKDLKTSTNPISTWIDTKADDEQAEVLSLVAGLNTEGTRQIQALFEENVFIYAKPTSLVLALAEQVTSGDERVMDFFAGSGTTAHAVMDLNRQKGGNRRYILVEVGNYFDDVLKPRIQRVAFSANWKDGVPQDRDGMSHIFKYQRLESYEDALNNIRVHPPEGAQLELIKQFDDYMLHYMLDFETRGSPTLLAQETFEKPFDCTLKIQRGHKSPQDTKVDLVETFHYLIGLHVRRLERHEHQGRTYVVSRGEVRTERGIEKVVTLWRDTEGLDREQEAKWVNEHVLTDPVDRVYVNGPSFIHKAEPLEITFRERM